MVTILIGQYDGRVTVTSTETGDVAQATREEWAAFVRRVKSGRLDHVATAEPGALPTPDLPGGENA